MNFVELALIEPLRRAVADARYTEATPIQAQSIPVLLSGRDLCGTAQTGTGKTAAFALPILQRLATPRAAGARRSIRALILAPTRELAAQIDTSIGEYARHLKDFRHVVVYGGMGLRAQRRALLDGVDLLVATPGRLLDLCGQRVVKLDEVEVFVLDEADRMLDMGFIADVRKLVTLLPKQRQTAMFSATMPKDIEALARQILRDPVRVSVARPAAVASRIEQRVFMVDMPHKKAKLLEILADPTVTSAIVFVRTKRAADRVAINLREADIRCGAIHGDKVQAERTRVLDLFARGRLKVLVATDVAARGIDIEGISHVINHDVPNVPEAYVHRIGRTGRAGAPGVAISLCAPSEVEFLDAIEKVTREKLTRVR